jgi:hypothetical protein
MAYLEPKGEGDRSMPENQRSCSDAEAMRWGARVIWRKLDCLNPNLQLMEGVASVGNRIWHRRRVLWWSKYISAASFGREAIPSEGIQGDEWGA